MTTLTPMQKAQAALANLANIHQLIRRGVEVSPLGNLDTILNNFDFGTQNLITRGRAGLEGTLFDRKLLMRFIAVKADLIVHLLLHSAPGLAGPDVDGELAEFLRATTELLAALQASADAPAVSAEQRPQGT